MFIRIFAVSLLVLQVLLLHLVGLSFSDDIDTCLDNVQPKSFRSREAAGTGTSAPDEDPNSILGHEGQIFLDEEDDDIETALLHAGILEFTYGDNDPKGPRNWEDLNTEDAEKCEFNCCGSQHTSPLNIDSRRATLAEGIKRVGVKTSVAKRSLEFILKNRLEIEEWTFGHPSDTWHGLEIRQKESKPGLFQIIDEYNSHLEGGLMISQRYDFQFAQVTYCDGNTLDNVRSSHQIDGKGFPLEINMLFFGESLANNICFRKSLRGMNKKYVMVSILGELSSHDNPVLEPLIKAASTFHGASNFDTEDSRRVVSSIAAPFSPTWLLPEGSNYYYYERGTFVVPPCYSIPRVYVLRKQIQISKRQLQTLTNIGSGREPSGKLSCTFGVLQEKINERDIHHNVYPIIIVGNDSRPLHGTTAGVCSIHTIIGDKRSSAAMLLLSPIIVLLYFFTSDK